MLNCGLHPCASNCHQLYDHSKISCAQIIQSRCPKGHSYSWKCHNPPPLSCQKCELKAKERDKKLLREFELQQKREEDQREHERQMALLDEKIELERQNLRDAQLKKEREHILRQREKDLEDVKELTQRHMSTPPTPVHASPMTTKPTESNSNATPSIASHLESRTQVTNTPKNKASQPTPSSPSRLEWERQKRTDNARNDAIDSLMDMIGLETVKSQLLRIKAKVDTTLRQNTDLKGERFGIVLLGNPGTGKTTVARLYAKFLTSIGVLPGTAFIETTGSRLANDGVPGVKKHIEEIRNAGGGTFFLDEAYQLTGPTNYGGSQVLEFLLAEIENTAGQIVFIFAGYNKQMEKFFEHNPGLSSRLPYTLQFEDYNDEELRLILQQVLEKKYAGRIKVEDGIDGLYTRIVARRLGRGRGREGFGNARALQNVFSKISERQAERLTKERRDGLMPDDFLLVKEDLIGPDPAEAILKSSAWVKLQELIGLEAVKDSVRSMIDRIQTSYRRELVEKEPVNISLNRVFFGSPGTGKTSVGKLYGQILSDLGLLSNGEGICLLFIKLTT